MPRLSIDITEEEHRRLKAIAVLRGVSLKDYVLSRALNENSEPTDMAEMAELLKPRIARADQGDVSTTSMRDIARARRAIRSA